MALRSSELPDNVKQVLLGQIRQQIGASQYDQMVNAVGEDQLLTILLAKRADSAKKEKRRVWKNIGEALLVVMLPVYILLAILAGGVIWKIVSWLLTGITQWWTWLGCHFY